MYFLQASEKVEEENFDQIEQSDVVTICQQEHGMFAYFPKYTPVGFALNQSVQQRK
jgi:hypothetical protein